MYDFENEREFANQCMDYQSVSLACLADVRTKELAGTVRGDSNFVDYGNIL